MLPATEKRFGEQDAQIPFAGHLLYWLGTAPQQFLWFRRLAIVGLAVLGYYVRYIVCM
jgi:hypothetical protein